MFLIRCSILNYVNADIEESQYYISQDLKILPYYLIAFQKKRRIPTCKTLVEIYSHCKGRCLAISSAKDLHRKDEYIHTKLQNTRPLTTMVLRGKKLCCWKLYKHMISYDFLYLFLNQRTYMFSLMHRNSSQYKPVSVSFLHIWQFFSSSK